MSSKEAHDGDEIHRITGAATVIASATMLSRVLGYVRDAVIAFAFGAGMFSDAFFVAFRISNLLRRLVGEGALTSSFVPIFTEEHDCRELESTREFVSSIFTLMLFSLTILAVLGILFAGPIVSLMSPGFKADPQKFAITVSLTRWMFPYMIFIGLMAIAMGVLNSLRHFFAPALSPVLFNLAIIASVLLLSPLFSLPIYALAIGVLIGGVLQFALQLPFLKARGMLPELCFKFKDPAIWRVFKLMGPASIGVGVYQLNIFVTLWFASRLAEGSVSYLYYAGRLMELPMGVFGVAISTALLPSLSGHVIRQEWDAFRTSFAFVLRTLNFLMIPAAVGLFVLSYPIVELLFTRGEFGSVAANESSVALYYYCIGLVPISLSRVLSSVFYSLKDTVTPLYIALVSFVVNLVFCIVLVGPMAHAGLALSTSIASIVNVTLLFIVLKRKFGSFGGRDIIASALKSISAAALMGAVIAVMYNFSGFDTLGWGLKALFVASALAVGILVYLGLSKLFKAEELTFLKGFILKRGSREGSK